MSNSILNQNMAQTPATNNSNLVAQFQQFRNSFQGDPKQAVMNMLNSGQINNAQLQQAMAKARQLQGLFR